jgi:pilus assembly protein Flp/PilA
MKTGIGAFKSFSLRQFTQDDSGQKLIEYALIAGLIGLAAVVAMTGLGTKISTAFNTIGSQLTNAL